MVVPLAVEGGPSNVGSDRSLVGSPDTHQQPPEQHETGTIPALLRVWEERETGVDDVTEDEEEAGDDTDPADRPDLTGQPAWRNYQYEQLMTESQSYLGQERRSSDQWG